MIINRKKAEGLNELNNLLKDVKSRTVVLFTGSTSDGQNWCSDCIKGFFFFSIHFLHSSTFIKNLKL